jgi:hypothetical protein
VLLCQTVEKSITDCEVYEKQLPDCDLTESVIQRHEKLSGTRPEGPRPDVAGSDQPPRDYRDLCLR